ncbi:hypothetical protein JHK82_025815 [Glycine max]|nr:hypothetical protein JHK82_025815 [Glycine max]
MGCGLGLRGETISENGHHWIGLDISASMLSIHSGSHIIEHLPEESRSRKIGRFTGES